MSKVVQKVMIIIFSNEDLLWLEIYQLKKLLML